MTAFAQLQVGYMRLSTTNVSDALDRLNIAGAPHGILPLWPGCRKIAGLAATMRLLPPGGSSDSPVVGSLNAVKAASPGNILVIDNAGRTDVNSFGGIVGFTARQRGLAGCVIDGAARDLDEYKQLDFPVYGRGIIQQSIRNRCAFGGHGIEASIAGVRVKPDDLVMADDNGVVVVPSERIEEVLKIATECRETEERIIEAIRGGADPVEAHNAARYDHMTAPGADA
jgi:4-hydroxy-4-methyl-2-oxoglutarate aldolase